MRSVNGHKTDRSTMPVLDNGLIGGEIDFCPLEVERYQPLLYCVHSREMCNKGFFDVARKFEKRSIIMTYLLKYLKVHGAIDFLPLGRNSRYKIKTRVLCRSEHAFTISRRGRPFLGNNYHKDKPFDFHTYLCIYLSTY